MRSLTSFLLISAFTLPQIVQAKLLSCPEVYPGEIYKLYRVKLKEVFKNQTYELAPSQDTTKNEMAYQTWDGFSAESQIFFTCIYANTTKTLEFKLPSSIHRCQFIFPFPGKETLDTKAKFFCKR
jgi:hypothetical protein